MSHCMLIHALFPQITDSLVLHVCKTDYAFSNVDCCFQVPPAHGVCLEGPKWVSRWASLADSYAEPGSTPPQGESVEGTVLWMTCFHPVFL